MLRRFLARQFARPSGWIGRFLIGPWLDRISRTMNRMAADRLDVRPGERVLEIGFGGGDLLALILERNPATVIGLDVSSAMVARARRRFAGDRRLALLEGSPERLPLANCCIDKAASLNSLYFWPDVPGALSELARTLVPGGTLLLGFEPVAELRKWPGHRHGFRLYEAEDVIRLAREAGFGNARIEEGRGRKPDLFLCLSLERLPDREPQ